MVPFALLKRFWKVAEFYQTLIKKNKHPVVETFIYNTAIPSISVLQIPTLWDSYCYIVVSGNNAIIIDPSDFNAISNELDKRNLKVPFIFITHEHIDHITAVAEIKKKYNSEVLAAKNVSLPCLFSGVIDGFTLHFGDIDFVVMSVPGHWAWPYPVVSSQNNMAWYSEKAQILFSGDVLFACGYGCIASGSDKTMWESLKKLRSLPGETMLYCGHEYTLKNTLFAVETDSQNDILKERFAKVNELIRNKSPAVPTSLKLENEINPFLRWDDERLKKQLGIARMGDLESFIRIRELKNEFNKRN